MIIDNHYYYSQPFLLIVTTTLSLILNGKATDERQCLKEDTDKKWNQRNDKAMLSYFNEDFDSATENSSAPAFFLDKKRTSRQLLPVADEQTTYWGLIQGFGYFQANTGHHPQFLTETDTYDDENDSGDDNDDFFTFQSQLGFYTCIFQGGLMKLFGMNYVQGVGHFQCFVQGTGPLDTLIFYQTLDFYQFNFQGVRLIQGFRSGINGEQNQSGTMMMMDDDDFSFLFPVEADIPSGGRIKRKGKRREKMENSNSRQQQTAPQQRQQQRYMQFFGKSTMNFLPMSNNMEIGGVYQYFMGMDDQKQQQQQAQGQQQQQEQKQLALPLTTLNQSYLIFPPLLNFSSVDRNSNIFERKQRDGGFLNVQGTDSRRRIFLQDLLSSSGHFQYNLRGQRGGAQSLIHGQYNFFQEMASSQSFNFRATARTDDLGVNSNVGRNPQPPVIQGQGSRQGPGPGPGFGFLPQPPTKYLQILGQYENKMTPPKIIQGVGRITENLRILLTSQFNLQPRSNISNLPRPDYIQLHGHYSYSFQNFQRRPGGISFDATALYNYDIKEDASPVSSPPIIPNTFLSPRENYFQGGGTFSFSTGTGIGTRNGAGIEAPSSVSPLNDRISLRAYTTFTIYEKTPMRNFGHLQFQGRWEHDFSPARLGLGGSFRIQTLGQVMAPVVLPVNSSATTTSAGAENPNNIPFEKWLKRVQLHGYAQFYLLYYLDLNRLGLLEYSRGVSRIDLNVIFHQDRRQAGVRLPNLFPPNNNTTITAEEKKRNMRVTQFIRFQLFFNYGGGRTRTGGQRGYTQLIFEYYLDL